MRVEPKKPSRNHQKVNPNHQKVIPEPTKKHPATIGKSPRHHAKVIPGIRVRCSETLWKCERDAQDRPVGAGRTEKVIPEPSKSHPETNKSSPRNQQKVIPKPTKSHPETTQKSSREYVWDAQKPFVNASEMLRTGL